MVADDPSSVLPEEFKSLQAYVAAWALPSMQARHQRRLSSTPEERETFYRAVAPAFDAIMKHLNTVAMESLAGPDATLMQLALSFTEIALSQEIFDPRLHAAHTEAVRRVSILRTADDI
ncbi:MAG: hypothetical protein ABW034_02155 [Steroidobacteraceae bacterium]